MYFRYGAFCAILMMCAVCTVAVYGQSTTPTYQTRGTQEYVCGDANGDGSLNIGDAVFLINFIFKGGPGPDANCCEDCPSTVTDIDGNTYTTVKIGDQCWMVENLKVTHYRNGDPIDHVTAGATWGGLTTGAYCEYNNDPANVPIYGRLYNWAAADDPRGLAPNGWHVPTDAEWKQLEMSLGMSPAEADGTEWRGTTEGGKLKEAGTVHWTSPNNGATNESGFTALPGGYRDDNGNFGYLNVGAYFWASTDYSSGNAWFRYLGNFTSMVGRYYIYEQLGFSVRCVRD